MNALEISELASESREFAERSAVILRAKERLAEIEREEICYTCAGLPEPKSASEIAELLRRGARFPKTLRRVLRHPEKEKELQQEARTLLAVIEKGDL